MIVDSGLLILMCVWFALNLVTVPLTWRLIWPSYKRYGKVVFSFVVSWGLAAYAGWWSLLFIIGHPVAGFAFHVWWCRKHNLSVWRPDAEAYRKSTEAWAAHLRKQRQR